MPETVAITYIGGHDAVDIPKPDGFGDIASDVKQGQSVDVPEHIAKSLLEQADNWQKTEPKREAKAEKKGNE